MYITSVQSAREQMWKHLDRIKIPVYDDPPSDIDAWQFADVSECLTVLSELRHLRSVAARLEARITDKVIERLREYGD